MGVTHSGDILAGRSVLHGQRSLVDDLSRPLEESQNRQAELIIPIPPLTSFNGHQLKS